MRCTKCGYDNNAGNMYCDHCGAPLGNTSYRPIKRKKSKKLRIILIVILLFLLASAIGGLLIYRYIVKKACVEVTGIIFDHARTLDFSDIDKDILPDALKEEPNLRNLVEKEIKSQLKSSILGKVVPVDDLDLDPIIDEIVKDASYEITDVDFDWNRCTVTVHTENTDFSKVPENLAELLKDDATDTESELWQGLSKKIKGILPFVEDDEDEPEWSEIILYYYLKAKKESPKIEKDGKLVYGFEGSDFTGWTILSYDRDLIRGFYGVEIPDELFDQFIPSDNGGENKE